MTHTTFVPPTEILLCKESEPQHTTFSGVGGSYVLHSRCFCPCPLQPAAPNCGRSCVFLLAALHSRSARGQTVGLQAEELLFQEGTPQAILFLMLTDLFRRQVACPKDELGKSKTLVG